MPRAMTLPRNTNHTKHCSSGTYRLTATVQDPRSTRWLQGSSTLSHGLQPILPCLLGLPSSHRPPDVPTSPSHPAPLSNHCPNTSHPFRSSGSNPSDLPSGPLCHSPPTSVSSSSSSLTVACHRTLPRRHSPIFSPFKSARHNH
ncbi:hypothetical protein BDQ12DRAFT_199253 [Crucibulum laeve]|uniref:Uncharacterized protein n=1 Tax=Crucibulum laeve TaxID=68775 RepID=A0A5C3MEL2_9AGAR|nr:hypothetical protein BDQ12DRAFT_199253 [Crucibulum laeve]